MKRELIIGGLFIAMLMVSGCAVSDYLTGTGQEEPYSLLEEEAELDDIDEILKELEEIDDEEVTEEETDKEVTDDEESEEVDDEDVMEETSTEDTITYTFSEPLDENGRWETDYSDAGEYLITVTASDGVSETSRKVLLVVNKINVAPIIKNIPNARAGTASVTVMIDFPDKKYFKVAR